MGSSGSRPGQRKVAPCTSLRDQGEQSQPQWTVPALPFTLEQPSGALENRKKTLPPLKQDARLSTHSEPYFAGNFPPKQSQNLSIIHSHPPRRPQALQPLALQIGNTSTGDQIVMGRNSRDGAVQPLSTSGQTGTGRMIQGGFLEAQTALTQQAHRQRRAHLRHAREQRRHKVVYTVNDGNTAGIQKLKLVRRPTEMDIFWDETTGERLDPDRLLDPQSLPDIGEHIQRNNHSNSSCARDKNPERSRGIQLKPLTREMMRVEGMGKTQRGSLMGPESTRHYPPGRIRGARGIWDYKMD